MEIQRLKAKKHDEFCWLAFDLIPNNLKNIIDVFRKHDDMNDDFSLVATLALGVSSGTKRCGITCSDATAVQLIIVQLF